MSRQINYRGPTHGFRRFRTQRSSHLLLSHTRNLFYSKKEKRKCCVHPARNLLMEQRTERGKRPFYKSARVQLLKLRVDARVSSRIGEDSDGGVCVIGFVRHEYTNFTRAWWWWHQLWLGRVGGRKRGVSKGKFFTIMSSCH